MSTSKKILFIALGSVPGIIISYIIFFIIGRIMIPDECYYHSNEPNWFINLMFDFPSWNGNHPVESYFQLTLIGLFGIFLSYRYCKKRMKS